ncbi:YtxH domain-containing protein [Streptomyces durbertensis]|uniref:YtxH domain-containing protein n=1 Tax=Streptomyces durbertensis TaxID=2448886 RepID=A0ABR6EKI2_9ACTN|nr:YtxH domain-containing protein [Streptomyces durbertensis]MBB1245831.1 YtxH domain-containing protein [Streptomyces durbertensis]
MRHRLIFVAGIAVGYVLGARAGRERYEQLREKARQITENPAVRNTVESAAQNGRQAASRAAHVVGERVGDRLPPAVGERLRAVTGGRSAEEEDWGTTNT